MIGEFFFVSISMYILVIFKSQSNEKSENVISNEISQVKLIEEFYLSVFFK